MIEKKTKLIPFDVERYNFCDYIEVQTRNGDRVVILSAEIPNAETPIMGYYMHDGKGYPAVWLKNGRVWADGRTSDCDLMMLVEDVPESTPLDIPWQYVEKKWKCAAMDKNRTVFFYTNEPEEYVGGQWVSHGGSCMSQILAVNTDGIIPELSLTKRGE